MARKTRKGAEDRVSTFGSSIINMAFDAVKFLGVVTRCCDGVKPRVQVL